MTKDQEVVKTSSREGFQALGLAAYLGELDIVQFLPEKRADANTQARNPTGFTALTGAVSNRHRAIGELLILRGANVNHRYEAGYSPLLTAADDGNVDMTKLLIAHGADVNARTSDGRTTLSISLQKGHHEAGRPPSTARSTRVESLIPGWVLYDDESSPCQRP